MDPTAENEMRSADEIGKPDVLDPATQTEQMEVDQEDAGTYYASTYFWEDYYYDDEVEPFEFKIPERPKRQHTDFRAYGYIEYYRYDGVIFRGADVRHIRRVKDYPNLKTDYYMQNYCQFCEPSYRRKKPKKAEIAAIPRRRLQQIREVDPFGMDSCGVNYALGKKKRWEFATTFQRNPTLFTTDDPTIQTVMFESTDHDSCNFFGILSPFPMDNCMNRGDDSIRRMVWLDSEGALRVVENKKGWAQAANVFPILPEIDGVVTDIPLPKPRRPTRRDRRAARRRRLTHGIDEQWDPIRLTYYVHTPRPTQKLLNSTQFRRFGHRSYEWRDNRKPWGEKPPPSVRMDYQLDDCRFDDVELEEFEDERFADERTHRRPMILADFIVEKRKPRNDSVGSDGSYVLIDAETFAIVEL